MCIHLPPFLFDILTSHVNGHHLEKNHQDTFGFDVQQQSFGAS
jgi:hypothetical protein